MALVIMVMNVGQSEIFLPPVSIAEFLLRKWMCNVAVGMNVIQCVLYDNVELELIEF